jgi:hypothetical protein
MISSLPRRLVDQIVDAYVDWREECTHVWEAYRRWLGAVGVDAVLAFRAYRAALDREERASEVYADLIRRLGPVVADAALRVASDRPPKSGASEP